ncbi:MAG: AAA family ATPase, partial [Acidimicrobiia bacterium]
MRPLELTLRGFQSYAGSHVFDFRDRSLLGVVGPIGSGKSSLLDGIAFALYGKTPRAGRNTRDLINQRKDSAHVELWFEVDGEFWRAVRALRKKGQSAHKLYRHGSDDQESEVVESLEKQADISARIEQLLGLDFDAFNRSVFLAQNRFAELLQATPGDRDAVLKGVFGFDRLSQMAAVAKDKRDGIKAELADLERLRREVEADRLARDEAGPALEAATARLAQLDTGHEKEAELRPALAAADRDLEASAVKLNELADLAAQLPAREQSGLLLDRAEAGSGELDSARSALADASERLETARRHQVEAVAATGGPETLQAVGLLLERRAEMEKRLAGLERQGKDSSGRVESAEQAREVAVAREAELEVSESGARAAAAEAAAAAEEADRALHQARHDSMALTLRRELADGDTCPVCAQVVGTAPSAGGEPKLDAAEEAARQARTGRDAAQGTHTRATADLGAAHAAVEAAATVVLT